MLKQLFLIAFCVFSYGSLVFTCEANHNLYIASTQTTASVDCLITSTDDEALSNNQNTSFTIYLRGIDPPAPSTIQDINVDGNINRVYYQSFTNVAIHYTSLSLALWTYLLEQPTMSFSL